jgi:cyclophilin family peptidyl-prolyl cis-trans isomerase/HEAT repeat protein
MRLFRLMLALMLLPLVLLGQKLSDSEREILMLQDQRSLGDGRLLSYLSNPDSHLRFRALIALANIQDISTDSAVAVCLSDPVPHVREAAAFALGQIGGGRYLDSLLSAMRRESDSTALGRIFEAIGRAGDEHALDQVVDFPGAAASTHLTSEQVLSVARFALRGIKNEHSIWFCFEQATHPDAEVRWRALFALWRSAPHGLIDVEIAKRESVLVNLAQDPSADVRVNLTILLARSKSSYVNDLVGAVQTGDHQKPNWQVEVQLARTFAVLSATEPERFNDLIDCLSATNDHVKIAALQAFSGLSKQAVDASADTARLRTELLRLAMTRNPSAELTRGEAFVALGKLFPDEFARTNFLAEKDISVRERTKVLEALSFIPSGRSLSIIFFALDDPNVRVAMAAWDFVRRFLTPSTIAKIRSGNQEWGDARTTLYRKTLNALGRRDMAITHLVSNALADTLYFGMFREGGLADSLILSLNSAFALLASPDDVEAMQAAAAAMGQIGDSRFIPALEKALRDPDKTVATAAAIALHQINGKDYTSSIPKSTKPLHKDYDWSALESITSSSRAVIKTSKGTIKIQLLRDEAPFTVLSFFRLVQKKFYDGLAFHRVVPNFVVQGGDPRGDGWGGAGYAIRSEYSLVRFERGMLGIASAGKDTEGCQFFITHLPTPHLDGRYTIFARVLEGQDVVDRIQIGDTIERITIE